MAQTCPHTSTLLMFVMKTTEMSTTKPAKSQCRIKQGRTPRSKMAKRTHFKLAFDFFIFTLMYLYVKMI